MALEQGRVGRDFARHLTAAGVPHKWWEFTETTNVGPIANELSELILTKVVPYLQRYLSTDA